jgi:hypothetical protein
MPSGGAAGRRSSLDSLLTPSTPSESESEQEGSTPVAAGPAAGSRLGNLSSGIACPMLNESSRCKSIWFSCRYLKLPEADAVAVEGMSHADSLAGGRGPAPARYGSAISDLSCSRFAYSMTAPCGADGRAAAITYGA